MIKCCDKYGSRFAKSKYVWNGYDDDDENAWKLVVSFRSRIKNSHGLYNLCSQFIRNSTANRNAIHMRSFHLFLRTVRTEPVHTRISGKSRDGKQQATAQSAFRFSAEKKKKSNCRMHSFSSFSSTHSLTRVVWYCVYLVGLLMVRIRKLNSDFNEK